jgi:hypothetical protein
LPGLADERDFGRDCEAGVAPKNSLQLAWRGWLRRDLQLSKEVMLFERHCGANVVESPTQCTDEHALSRSSVSSDHVLVQCSAIQSRHRTPGEEVDGGWHVERCAYPTRRRTTDPYDAYDFETGPPVVQDIMGDAACEAGIDETRVPKERPEK